MLNTVGCRTRVLHVVGESTFGGGAKVIQAIANAAVLEGYSVDILTTDQRFQETLRDRGVGVVDLDVIRRPIRPLADLAGLLRLRKFLRSNRYAIVHTHTTKGGIVGRIAARLAGVPLIVHTVHGLPFHEGSRRSTKIAAMTIERIASMFGDVVITVSDVNARVLSSRRVWGAARVMSIPNGVPDPHQRSFRPRADIRSDWLADADDVLIICPGRLAPQKGLEYLIEAMSLVTRDQTAGVKCLIVGDGPLMHDLTQMIKDRHLTHTVTLTGFCSDVEELVFASDIVVLPSVREGLSIALLEGLASGTPVVATSIAGNLEAIGDSGAATVPTADPARLAQEIRRLLRSPSLRGIVGAAGRARYEESYRLATMTDAYLEAYRRYRVST